MKRILTTFAIVLLLIGTGGLLSINLSIRSDVKSNIRIAQEKYGGTPEEALIAFLIDESNSKTDRTHAAIWTLGQIESEKALPVLKEFYKDDPEGKTCYGNHDQMLCQYEIFKALQAIEKGKLFSYSGLR